MGSVASRLGESRGITSSGTHAADLDQRTEPKLVSCCRVATLIPTLPDLTPHRAGAFGKGGVGRRRWPLQWRARGRQGSGVSRVEEDFGEAEDGRVEECHEASAHNCAHSADAVDERERGEADEEIGHDLDQLGVGKRHAPGQLILDRSVRGAQLRDLGLQSDLQGDRVSAGARAAQPAVAQRRIHQRAHPLEHCVVAHRRAEQRISLGVGEGAAPHQLPQAAGRAEDGEAGCARAVQQHRKEANVTGQ
eukprot:scaffold3162_cov101-Isochrysis_galbana.AAC.9